MSTPIHAVAGRSQRSGHGPRHSRRPPGSTRAGNGGYPTPPPTVCERPTIPYELVKETCERLIEPGGDSAPFGVDRVSNQGIGIRLGTLDIPSSASLMRSWHCRTNTAELAGRVADDPRWSPEILLQKRIEQVLERSRCGMIIFACLTTRNPSAWRYRAARSSSGAGAVPGANSLYMRSSSGRPIFAASISTPSCPAPRVRGATSGRPGARRDRVAPSRTGAGW